MISYKFTICLFTTFYYASLIQSLIQFLNWSTNCIYVEILSILMSLIKINLFNCCLFRKLTCVSKIYVLLESGDLDALRMQTTAIERPQFIFCFIL